MCRPRQSYRLLSIFGKSLSPAAPRPERQPRKKQGICTECRHRRGRGGVGGRSGSEKLDANFPLIKYQIQSEQIYFKVFCVIFGTFAIFIFSFSLLCSLLCSEEPGETLRRRLPELLSWNSLCTLHWHHTACWKHTSPKPQSHAVNAQRCLWTCDHILVTCLRSVVFKYFCTLHVMLFTSCELPGGWIRLAVCCQNHAT